MPETRGASQKSAGVLIEWLQDTLARLKRERAA